MGQDRSILQAQAGASCKHKAYSWPADYLEGAAAVLVSTQLESRRERSLHVSPKPKLREQGAQGQPWAKLSILMTQCRMRHCQHIVACFSHGQESCVCD